MKQNESTDEGDISSSDHMKRYPDHDPGIAPGGESKGNTPDVMVSTEIPTVTVLGKSFSRTLVLVHINIVLYAACFWIQIGVLPYLSRTLELDPVVFGYLQTTFAVVQLCGAPVFGRFGDLYGGRAAMTLAFASATLSYLLLAMTDGVAMLFLSRLPSLLMHAMQGGQMIVTDLAPTAQRADALGKLGISYGIGMVVGPVIGGILTKQSTQWAALVACVGSVFSMSTCAMLLPQFTKQHVSSCKQGIPIGIFQSMFQMVMMNTFQLEPDQNGYMMSYIGIIAMIVQGVGIRLLLQKYSDLKILQLSGIILIFAYALLAFAGTVWQLCLVLVPLCIGLTLMNVVISSALTKTVDTTDTGAMLGMNMAVNNVIRTISPTIGGIMLASWGFPAFGYLGFGTSLLVTWMLFNKLES